MITVGTVLDTLVEDWSARSAFYGWSVFSAAAGPDAPEKRVELAYQDIDWDEELLGMSEDEKMETYPIPGRCYCAIPGKEIEATIKAARDGVALILDDIETYLMDDPTLGGACEDVQLEAGKLQQGIIADGFQGRYAAVEFTLRVKATKTL